MFISFLRHNISIDSVKSFNDLEIIFDSKLCFNNHIAKISKKTYSNLRFITRTCSSFNNFNIFKTVNIAFVRSHLEYAPLI